MFNFVLNNKKLVVFLLLLYFFACKKPTFKEQDDDSQKKENNVPTTVVIYSKGESRIIHSDMTEEKARLGVAFFSGDRVITGSNGRIDIQTSDKSIIRVRPNTILDFSKIEFTKEKSKDVQLTIHSGSIFVLFHHKNKKDRISVLSQTAKALAIGTMFIVENSTEGEFIIKVVEGKVSVSPRILAIDNDKSDILTKNKQYEKLIGALSKKTIILKENQEVSYPSKELLLSAEILNESVIEDIVLHLSRFKASIEKVALTKNDEQDIQTIITVEPDIVKRMAEVNKELSSGQIDEKKAEKLDAELENIHSTLTKKLDVEKGKFTNKLLETPKKFNSTGELIKYYEKIEKIVLKKGKPVVGAILDQKGNTMIIHTSKGLQKVQKKEITEVVYDYQNKIN